VYFISHNIAREEIVGNKPQWVHRKGATRAFPGGHHALKGTPFADTGHPILLPGNPRDGSVVMAALPGAVKSCYSVNHGAGRQMGRKAAFRALDQAEVDSDFEAQGTMRTMHPSNHMRTNAEVIEAFLPVKFRMEDSGAGPWVVTVAG
jgi:tRNA-splicing ligase RtcB